MGPRTQDDHNAELHQRVLAGDATAQAELYERLGPSVRRAACRILHCDHLAADVGQDVFVAYFGQPHKCDPDRGPVRTYLAMMARRRAIDLVRSREAERRRQHLVTVTAAEATAGSDAVEALITRLDVRLAVRALPRSQRIVIDHAYGRDRSYRDTARDLGLAEGTVKSRARLAMARLRRESALAA